MTADMVKARFVHERECVEGKEDGTREKARQAQRASVLNDFISTFSWNKKLISSPALISLAKFTQWVHQHLKRPKQLVLLLANTQSVRRQLHKLQVKRPMLLRGHLQHRTINQDLQYGLSL